MNTPNSVTKVSQNQNHSLNRITDTGLIAVLRGIRPQNAEDVVNALLAAGVLAIEFTADSPQSMKLIRSEGQRLGNQASIGVGTVLDAETARTAIDVGAKFVVTPTFDVDIVSVCSNAGIPVIAGAYTPTEAVKADKAGSDLIKIFPASTGGPDHIRAFDGPLQHLSLIPTGGVTVDTAGEYISNGACAVGMGGGLFPEGALENGRYDEIKTRTSEVLKEIQTAQ